MTTAERLILARGNESRQSVCDAVGISLSALQMYENGKRIPRDYVKVRLAHHYRTSVQDLFYPEMSQNVTESQ